MQILSLCRYKQFYGMHFLPDEEDAAVDTAALLPVADALEAALPDLLELVTVTSSCLWRRLVSR